MAQFVPVPLRRARRGVYAGRGVTVREGPSTLSYDPGDAVQWTPTHAQIYGPNVGAADVLAHLRAMSAQRSTPPDIADLRAGPQITDVGGLGPVGESHASAPFTRVPGRRYFTYANQAGRRVRPGQQLRFTPGLGYWAGPQAPGYHPYQPF
jgi:hypothetical protein